MTVPFMPLGDPPRRMRLYECPVDHYREWSERRTPPECPRCGTMMKEKKKK
jgi:hypothetical protein